VRTIGQQASLPSGENLKNSNKIVWLVVAFAVIAAVVIFGFKLAADRREAEFATSLKTGTNALESGNTSDAVLRLEKAVAINPEDDRAHLNLGLSYSAEGKTKEAKKEFEESIALNPNQPEVQFRLGVIYKSDNDLDKALVHIEKAKELNKNLYPADIMAANIYREMGKPDRAVSILNVLIKTKPFGMNLADVHVDLGLTYKAQGKNDLAKQQWEAALKIDQNNAQAKKLLGVK